MMRRTLRRAIRRHPGWRLAAAAAALLPVAAAAQERAAEAPAATRLAQAEAPPDAPAPAGTRQPEVGGVTLPTLEIEGRGEAQGGAVRGFVATQGATGTKTSTPLVETPQSISVVPRSQIDARQAQTLGEALRYTAGIRPEAFGPDARVDWFSIRGFEAQGTGIYLDGLRYNLGFAGAVYETYGLQSLEVLRGPASVLYGQVTPGGLVNMASRTPSTVPQGEVRLTAGSYDRFQGAFNLGGPLTRDGTWSYGLTGLARTADTQVDKVRDDRLFLAPTLTWRPTADTSLTILPYYQRDRTVGGQFLPFVGTVTPTPFGRIPTNRFTGEPGFDKFDRTQLGIGYQFEHRFDTTWSVRQNLRYAHVGINWNQVTGLGLAADGRSLNRFAFTADTDIDSIQVDNQVEARFATGPLRHTLLAGFDYSHGTLRNIQSFAIASPLDMFQPVYGSPIPQLAPSLNSRQVTRQFGLYAQDQIRLGENWVLTVGGRQDWINSDTDNRLAGTRQENDDSAFTWRAGLVYRADSGLAPYVSYARSFLPTIGTNAQGQGFSPTEGEQYEVGVKYQPPGFNSFVQASAFHLTQRNALTADPANALFQVQTGEVRVRGVELEGVASLAQGLSVVAAFTYLDPEITRSNVPGEVGSRPVGVPKTTAALYGDYTVPEGSGWLNGFGFGAGLRFIGNSTTGNAAHNVVPSVTLVDAALRYDLGRVDRALEQWQLALNVSNLFDK
jgi:iron complex outermembrane recepter protein